MIEPRFEDFASARRRLQGMEYEIPFATARALTWTAGDAQADLADAMKRKLDNPRPYTLNATFKKPASKRKLFATVGLKDFAPKGTPASKYLAPLIEGGKRGDKRVERAMRFKGLLKPGQFLVPGDDAKLNKYGNLTGGQVTKALSNIGGQIDTYQNTTDDPSRRTRKRGGRQYFWMPGTGIYWRQGKRGIRSFMVVTKQPRYRAQFPFDEIVLDSSRRHLPRNISKSIDMIIEENQRNAGAPPGGRVG